MFSSSTLHQRVMGRFWILLLLIHLRLNSTVSAECTLKEVKGKRIETYTENSRYNRNPVTKTREVDDVLYSYVVCQDLTIPSGHQLGEYTDKKLQYILVENSKLGLIPTGAFSKYQTITEIYLNNTATDTLHPGAFAGLTSLKELYLQENNITKVSAGILNTLSRLQKLNLSSNAVEVIQEEAFLSLQRLESVDLSRNKLKHFPQTVFYETAALQTVDLSFNNILSLPKELMKTANDELSVTLSNNNLTSVDLLTFPSNLQTLNLRNNFITSLSNSEHLRKITKMDLSHNSLQNVTAPSTLKYLYLSHNNFSSLGSSNLRRCTDLQLLELSYNSIRNLDEDAFADLTRLEYFNIDFNALTKMPAGLFRNLGLLGKLNISYNKISKLDYGSFAGLKSLRYLDLAGNKLDFLLEDSFYELESLRGLNISYNKLTSFDPNSIRQHLPNLQEVDIKGNPWTCKSLIRILSIFERSKVSKITVAEGTAPKSESLRGITCINESAAFPNSKEALNLSPSDVQNVFDVALNASLQKHFQNFKADLLKAFLELFNDEFRNTTFYEYFTANSSYRPTVLTKLAEELQNFDFVLSNVTDRFAEKLSPFSNSDLRRFFEDFNETDFYKMFNSDFDEMKEKFDSEFERSTFFKLLNQSILKKDYDDILRYPQILAVNNSYFDMVEAINRQNSNVTMFFSVTIVVILMGMCVKLVSRFKKAHFKKRLAEHDSVVRITRGDLELS